MRKNRINGFTLSEVLIAVGIIGVIAAISIPAFYENYQRQILGAQLSKAVEQIETGCANILNDANSRVEDGSLFTSLIQLTNRDLYGNDVDNPNDNIFGDGKFISRTKGYFGLSELTGDEKDNFFNEHNISLTSKNIPLSSNKGSFSMYEVVDQNPIRQYRATEIYIDVNGNQKPNAAGKDMFRFGIDDRGRLVPAGTEEYKNLDFSNAELKNFPLASDACIDGKITNYWSCTARVVQEGYKITYK